MTNKSFGLVDLIEAVEKVRSIGVLLVKYNAHPETWKWITEAVRFTPIDPREKGPYPTLVWGTPAFSEDWIYPGCIQAVFSDGTYSIIDMRTKDVNTTETIRTTLGGAKDGLPHRA